MPARSAVLNVSITAKPLRDESVIQQVRETSSSPVEVTILDKMAEAHRGRVDSAASTDIPAIDTQFANSPSYVDFSGNSLAATQRVRECATCRQTTKLDGSPLAHCKGCKAIHYCGRACQRVDWASHKRNCDHPSNPHRWVFRTASAPSTAALSVPASPISAPGSP